MIHKSVSKAIELEWVWVSPSWLCASSEEVSYLRLGQTIPTDHIHNIMSFQSSRNAISAIYKLWTRRKIDLTKVGHDRFELVKDCLSFLQCCYRSNDPTIGCRWIKKKRTIFYDCPAVWHLNIKKYHKSPPKKEQITIK